MKKMLFSCCTRDNPQEKSLTTFGEIGKYTYFQGKVQITKFAQSAVN